MQKKALARWLRQGKKKNKFGAIRTRAMNGVTCDSKLEARHYNLLLDREKKGEISELYFHPSFDLTVKGVKLGKAVLDFKYNDNTTGKTHFVDSKGRDTDISKWKRKHLEAQYGIKVELWRA